MIRASFYRGVGVFALVGLVSCADRIVAITANESTDAHVGDLVRVQIRLITFQIDTPPAISSNAIRFIGVVDPEKVLPPGGPLLEYRFLAVSPGQAIIQFRKSSGFDTSFIYDTVNVR